MLRYSEVINNNYNYSPQNANTYCGARHGHTAARGFPATYNLSLLSVM